LGSSEELVGDKIGHGGVGQYLLDSPVFVVFLAKGYFAPSLPEGGDI